MLVEQGFALYELCRFDEARAVLLRAEALDPDEPWTQHHLGLVAERQGDADEARRRFARAHRLDPDAFSEPIALTPAAFDAAVEDALAEIPEQVRRYLANVAITVEDLPSDDDSSPPIRRSRPPSSGCSAARPTARRSPWIHGATCHRRSSSSRRTSSASPAAAPSSSSRSG